MTVLVIPPGTARMNTVANYVTGVLFPSGITAIGAHSLSGCVNLKTLVIPDGVTEIGVCAFYMCSGLQTLVIPASVTTIGHYSVSGCIGLERVWDKSKCKIGYCEPWIYIQGPTPSLKDLETWTFALHWHWRYPDRITSEQTRLFTIGFHCLAVPTELCQAVFSYIPRA
jgi:hypothetical protein